MRALIQRVSQASVSVHGEKVGSIGPGLVVFLGIRNGDTLEDARYLVDKSVNLRIFSDAEERFNVSAQEGGFSLLVISQFTLYASTRKGRRPSFTEAAPPSEAGGLFAQAVEMFRDRGLRVETGRFQEHMLVDLTNDGPVTILLDSEERLKPRSEA